MLARDTRRAGTSVLAEDPCQDEGSSVGRVCDVTLEWSSLLPSPGVSGALVLARDPRRAGTSVLAEDPCQDEGPRVDAEELDA